MSIEWNNKPLHALGRLAWPITISSLSYSVMTLVDTILVGHLGRAELAGVGLGGIMAFVFLCFSIGLLRGVNTLVAQTVGAGRPEEARGYQGAAVVVAVALGVVTLGVGLIAAELLGRFAASPAAGNAARTYLRIRILAAPLTLMFVAFREVRYGQGQSRAPMRATIIANLVNVVLAYVLVFVCGAGVAGAAYATVVAQAVEAGALAIPAMRSGWGLAAFTRRHLRAIWHLGAPLGIQFTLEVGSFGLLSLLISGLSDVDMAAHQIALQVIHFSFLPAYAVAEASAVLVGQAVGARRDDLVLPMARLALRVTGIYTAAWTLVLVFGSRLIVSGFTLDPAVVKTTVALLHVAAVFQIIDAANLVGRAALRGAGDVRYAAVVGVATSWLCTPPVAWLLGYRMHLGAIGGWMGLCLEIMVGATLLWWRLQRGGWRASALQARTAVTDDHPDDGATTARAVA
jgi:multidrug resistance protein, MATE family